MTAKDWLAVFVMASTGTFLAMVFIVVSPMLSLVAEHFGGGTDGAFVAQWVLTMMDKAPLPVRGWAMGLLFSAQFFGPFINSSLIAPAIGAYGLRNMLAVIASLIAVGVVSAVLRARSAPSVQGSH